jgi:hypothetical protein
VSVQIDGISVTPIVRIGIFHCCTVVCAVIVPIVPREILPTVHVIVTTQAFIAFGNACSALPCRVVGNSNAVFMFFALSATISDTDTVFHTDISTDAVAGALRVESIDTFIVVLVPVRVVAGRQGARTVLVSF